MLPWACAALASFATELLYGRCLNVSTAAALSTGLVVNALSNDVQAFANAATYTHLAWIALIELVASTFFLYRYIGPSCFAGVGVFLAFLALQGSFLRLFSKYRVAVSRARVRHPPASSSAPLKRITQQDDRIRLVSDIILGIQMIKL